jgi:hypothetical protein
VAHVPAPIGPFVIAVSAYFIVLPHPLIAGTISPTIVSKSVLLSLEVLAFKF